ncbi:MAG: hypothetical protein WCG64_05080 [Flavobacteriia bacterium]
MERKEFIHNASLHPWLNATLPTEGLSLEKLVEETWVQFEKDVRSTGSSIEINKPIGPQQVFENAFIFLKQMSPASLPELMYRIDIPESLMNDITQSTHFYEDLTNAVLQREAMKVYLRHRYA